MAEKYPALWVRRQCPLVLAGENKGKALGSEEDKNVCSWRK
jgi:hypothetical protein